MRAPVARVVVRDTRERLPALALGEGDLLQAGSIERLETSDDDEFAVEVELERVLERAASSSLIARIGSARR